MSKFALFKDFFIGITLKQEEKATARDVDMM
jgi:hypothetical protein